MIQYGKDLMPITEICLNVTESCNLNCRYCFTEHHPNTMTLQVAKDTATWLRDNAMYASTLTDNKVIPTIGFFGGEPTLCWDSIIKPLVEWVEDLGWEFNFGITSNCVLMDKEKVDYMCEHGIGLLLSMDGDKPTQDYNRPVKKQNNNMSSFDLVNNNLPYIIQKLPDTTFRATIIPDTAKYLFDNIMYACDMGFRTIFAIINELEEWDEESREIVEQEIYKYSIYVIEACRRGEDFIRLRPFEQAIEKIIAIYRHDVDYCVNCSLCGEKIGPSDGLRCGLGDGYGSVNYRGDIFACQEVASRQGEKDIFYIGNIYTGIDENKLLYLRNKFLNREVKVYNYLNPEKCKTCDLAPICQSNFCQVNNYILYKDFSAMPDCWCWWNNLLLKYAKFVMEIMSFHDNEFFKKYLTENFVI